MSTTDRTDADAPVEGLVAACRDAGLVRLVGAADGDALAALGTLARALRGVDVPFQASVARFPALDGTEADVTVTVGAPGGDIALTEGPLAPVAYTAAREFGADPDPLLALAGAVAGGAVPGEDAPLYQAAEAQLERAPGIAAPVDDPAEGLAYTTLAHAPSLSGDETAAREAVDALETDDGRHVASLLATAAVEGAAPRAAEAVERALYPYVGGPFETLGGYADLLDAVARDRPGTGVALALGHDVRADALDAWRAHGERAHRALRTAERARYDGCLVVHAGDAAPLGTVARLAREFRTPEPVVLVLAGGEAAAYGDGARKALVAAADETGAETTGRGPTAFARGTDDEALVTAFRGAV